MICPRCRRYYDGIESLPGQWNDPTDDLCPLCMKDMWNVEKAKFDNERIRFTGELVTIGEIDFECDGAFYDGLYDLYIKVNGTDIYGLLDSDITQQIENELSDRMEKRDIIRQCKQIEKDLCWSKNPAKLRLKRSELDERLEKLEVAR